MQPTLNLNDQERLYFLQALNAVAWRDESLNSVWEAQLSRFIELFGLPSAGHGFRADAAGIAEKVNQISCPRVRLYFLRIIHDVHAEEEKNRSFLQGIKNLASTDNAANSFSRLYDQLIREIRFDGHQDLF